MVTDLVEIRQLGEAKAAENLRFRRYLKAHPHPDGSLRETAQEVAEQIDCTQCANCCRETKVSLSDHDIEALAQHLGVGPEAVVRQYTERDSEGGALVLRHNADGCVFLHRNLCLVYEARPRACREFPHLELRGRSLGARMSSVCQRACFCPIVYNTLEIYKQRIGWHG